ncbi:MAG: tRNA (adenosine(37)-N6)-threonylcarbamoyltransferase complex ATPase subunit type 1 TsaE [Rhodobacteraceae bacterium]|nr:MAG: tRNA (adenosine(37)-N6)-threonylcarbamoyltransferase complex ATPase subunit type 1 TsaE [Paracoccaceae bacterium]
MQVTLSMKSAEQTARLAEQIGATLTPGDCLLLSGPVGAGKTHFARHLIWSLLHEPEDVPSPTFTLVQTYDTTRGEVWHADLYRLSALDEVEELGLADAMETAICLIEWPEVLGPLTPPDALSLAFQTNKSDTEARHITVSGPATRWQALLGQFDHDT